MTGVLQGAGDTFEGTLDITSITRNGTVLTVTGAIDGLLNGEPISDTFTATLDLARGNGNQGNGQGQGSCRILFLELGPLFLDVLGLVVEIPDPIILDVRAEPGPGNLLGNLRSPDCSTVAPSPLSTGCSTGSISCCSSHSRTLWRARAAWLALSSRPSKQLVPCSRRHRYNAADAPADQPL